MQRKGTTNLDFSGQKIFVGFDVHKKNWVVSVMSESLLLKKFSQPPKPELLVNYLHRNYPGAEYYTAYEAGFSGFWIHYELEKAGIHSMVVNAADIPTTSKESLMKEDKRDSLKIAQALRGNLLHPIHIPDPETVDDRILVRSRNAITRDMCVYKNRVKSLLNLRGIEIPAQLEHGSKSWSKNFISWLRSLTLDSTIKATLEAYIENCLHLKASKLRITRQISELSKTEKYDSRVKLLRSAPGIGLITSMELLTEIESINRFKTVDRFQSFIGFVPSTFSSGERERTGRMTPRGHGFLRSAMIESAWTAVRHDPALTKKYEELKRRMSGNHAIIRIAKKYLSKIYSVLKSNQPYQVGKP